ncbi:MAG: DUF3990 domain-containing protein [Ruminococcaceae bacterium]|nr:DUF3990 domain-containing protein [Oscillospiraceae bacterium]
MKNELIIYHGSENIIEVPEYGKGKPYNDYGLGFYCTEYVELAKEWACDDKHGGFANKYILDTTGLPKHLTSMLTRLLNGASPQDT